MKEKIQVSEMEISGSDLSSNIEQYQPQQEKKEEFDVQSHEPESTVSSSHSVDLDIEKHDLELHRTISVREISDEIPDKFSGWGLSSVIAVAIFNFNSWGSNSAYALYLQHYLSDDTFTGASKLDYAIIGGLSYGTGLSCAAFINFIIGVVGGFRPILVLGIIISFCGVFLASFSTELWQVYCTQGVLNGLGMGLIAVANIAIIPQWFKGGPGGKRNLAMGITAAGSGLGGIVYNIGLEPLLKEKSFRWSLRAQAIMSIGLNVIAFFLIKSRNDKIKPVFKVYDKLVWSCFGFICMVLWVLFTNFGYVVLMYSLGDFTKSLGYTSMDASLVSTCVAIGVVIGRPIAGQLADIIGPINITIFFSWIVAILSWAMWIPCRNFATAIVFALLVGSMMGTIWLTMATINASIVGLKKFGISVAVCWITTGVCGFASPIIGLSLKTNGPTSPTQYQPTSIFVGVCYFFAGACLWVLRSWIIQRNAKIDSTGDEDAMLRITINFKDVITGMIKPQWQKV